MLNNTIMLSLRGVIWRSNLS